MNPGTAVPAAYTSAASTASNQIGTQVQPPMAGIMLPCVALLCMSNCKLSISMLHCTLQQ